MMSFKISVCFVHNNPEKEVQVTRIVGVEQNIERACVTLLHQGYCERNTHKSLKKDILCPICYLINPWFCSLSK